MMRELNNDGLSLKEEEVMEKFALWQYNPPFTIPHFRRNEVWIELTEEQVELLRRKGQSS